MCVLAAPGSRHRTMGCLFRQEHGTLHCREGRDGKRARRDAIGALAARLHQPTSQPSLQLESSLFRGKFQVVLLFLFLKFAISGPRGHPLHRCAVCVTRSRQARPLARHFGNSSCLPRCIVVTSPIRCLIARCHLRLQHMWILYAQRPHGA